MRTRERNTGERNCDFETLGDDERETLGGAGGGDGYGGGLGDDGDGGGGGA